MVDSEEKTRLNAGEKEKISSIWKDTFENQ